MVRWKTNLRRAEFLQLVNMRVFVGTFNVNGLPPPSSGLADWIDISADIYAIGLQNLDTGYDVLLSNKTQRELDWQQAIKHHLGAGYEVIHSTRLVGIMLVVLIKKDHYAHVTDVDFKVVGTGFMGRFGNKVYFLNY